jgi:hypothetical protein
MIKYRKAACTVFLMMNTCLFETCPRKCNWLKILMKKCASCWFFVLIYIAIHCSRNVFFFKFDGGNSRSLNYWFLFAEQDRATSFTIFRISPVGASNITFSKVLWKRDMFASGGETESKTEKIWRSVSMCHMVWKPRNGKNITFFL